MFNSCSMTIFIALPDPWAPPTCKLYSLRTGRFSGPMVGTSIIWWQFQDIPVPFHRGNLLNNQSIYIYLGCLKFRTLNQCFVTVSPVSQMTMIFLALSGLLLRQIQFAEAWHTIKNWCHRCWKLSYPGIQPGTLECLEASNFKNRGWLMIRGGYPT